MLGENLERMHTESVQELAMEIFELLRQLCNTQGITPDQVADPTSVKVIGINENTGQQIHFTVSRKDVDK